MYFKEMQKNQKLIKKTALRYCKPSDLERFGLTRIVRRQRAGQNRIIAEEFQNSTMVEEVDPPNPAFAKFQDGPQNCP